jgi:peptide/nickel transport system substrate-binding protein
MKKLFCFAAGFALFLPALAVAVTLNVGAASGVNSLDPHFHNETPTNSANYNIFDGLVNFDEDLNPFPVLAESWKTLDDTTWEFNLRRGVKFHNGNAFTADDVVWSFTRARTGEKSGFKAAMSAIETVTKVDDYKVRVITKNPFPVLLRKLSYLRIMDAEYASKLSDEELGLKPVGTGPYKLEKWVRGQSLTLVANPDYFRGKPKIDRVVMRPLSNDSARVAAILSDGVHIINRVPVRDVERIKKQKGVRFHMRPGLRLIYLQFDHARENSPYISGVAKNPFQDVRVRKAFYLGINEEEIVKYIMGGFAEAAGQYYPSAVAGYDPSVKRPSYDPEKAKALLQESGYAEGFKVVLDSPNDRYINDEKIAQAVAASLAKIGITVEVNAIPKASFFPKANDTDSSFNLIGWACNDGDGSSFLDANVHTYDQEAGYGRYNGGRYSNPRADALIEESAGVLDTAKREKILQEVMRIALLEDQNIIPLHFQVDLYANSEKLAFEPRADTYLYFYDMHFN